MHVTRNKNINKVIIDNAKALQADNKALNQFLWDVYMVLDHGDTEERLAMLSKLENHFEKVGKPE